LFSAAPFTLTLALGAILDVLLPKLVREASVGRPITQSGRAGSGCEALDVPEPGFDDLDEAEEDD